LAFVGVVALLAIVGCGQQKKEAVVIEAAASFLASASERTTAVATGRFEARSTLVTVDGRESLDMTTRTSGEYDATLHRASLDLEVDGDVPADPSMPSRMRIIVDGDIAYVWGVPGHSDRWVRSEFSQGPGAGNGAIDPVSTLEYLEKASDDIAEIGRSSVRGVPTTQLSGTLSLGPAEGLSTDEDFAELTERTFGDLVDPPRFVVDVDSAGMVRRLELTFAFGSPAGFSFGEAFGFDMIHEIEYFDFGGDIEIPLPPADQVVEPSETECRFDDEGVFRC
jgi:hypothetical protein